MEKQWYLLILGFTLIFIAFVEGSISALADKGEIILNEKGLSEFFSDIYLGSNPQISVMCGILIFIGVLIILCFFILTIRWKDDPVGM